MHGGVHAGREGGIHEDAGFGVLGLEDAGVGDHADVADQAHQLDLIGGFGQNSSGGGVRHIHTEDPLVDGGGVYFLYLLLDALGITYLDTIVFILVIAALVCIFTITINERTKEFGILASLGAGSGKLAGLVLSEGCMIGLAGGLIGVIFSIVGLLIFGNTIVVLMDIPKLITALDYLLILGLKCMALALVVSIVASLYSAWKVSLNSLDTLIKGEEM